MIKNADHNMVAFVDIALFAITAPAIGICVLIISITPNAIATMLNPL